MCTTVLKYYATVNVVCLVTGLAIGAVVILLLFAQAFFMGMKTGMMARIMTTSAIYQKVNTCMVTPLTSITLPDVLLSVFDTV